MLIKKFTQNLLCVEIYKSRVEMGKAAADKAVAAIKTLLSSQDEVNVIFPAAPSQNEILAGLVDSGIDFSRVNAFHLDEYIGLPPDSARRFSAYLDKHVFGLVRFKSINYLGTGDDPALECDRYETLLKQYPPDVALIGIGENGHIAFNDPHVADFADKALVKQATLDTKCRMQQVNDGCFLQLDQVPQTALTLTIPALVGAKHIICTVPGNAKANAVRDAVLGKITTDCPASILQKTTNCYLFCDADSGKFLL